MILYYDNVIFFEMCLCFNVEIVFKKFFKFVVVCVFGISFLFYVRKWLDEDGIFFYVFMRKVN